MMLLYYSSSDRRVPGARVSSRNSLILLVVILLVLTLFNHPLLSIFDRLSILTDIYSNVIHKLGAYGTLSQSGCDHLFFWKACINRFFKATDGAVRLRSTFDIG